MFFPARLAICLLPAVTLALAQETPPSAGEPSPPPAAAPASAPPNESSASHEESPATPAAEPLKSDVPAEMRVFQGHVGRWRGITKTETTEKGKKTQSTTRSQWSGGYLLGGHVFEMTGFSHGELGRLSFRWQFSYDAVKERYAAAYYDSNGRTSFFEGKVDASGSKLVWRLIQPPGDMSWTLETDLKPEDGLDTNGKIVSQQFGYEMSYVSRHEKEPERK